MFFSIKKQQLNYYNIALFLQKNMILFFIKSDLHQYMKLLHMK